MTPDSNSSLGERVSLRPVVLPDDGDFLRDLYFTTRYDVEGVFPDENLKQSFLLMQHQAQMRGYADQFPEASHDIVELDGQAVGRLMVDRQPEFIRCIDISIIPPNRNSGIGSWLMNELLRECSERGVPCLLKVLVTSRANSLYERLGFQTESNDGVRFSMRWEG